MTPLVTEWESVLAQLSLSRGSHKSRESGVCAMEAAAWIAGREHSAEPVCVCPVIRAFMIAWNDNLPDNETRDRLLKPLLPVILETKATAAVERRRSYLALDWFIREHVPAWFDLTPALKPSGDALRAMDEITSAKACAAAMPKLREAQAQAAAARDAAGAAAGDAAVAAAAGAAAGDAAVAAAAGAAARAAAVAAAAGAAARDAAVAAAAGAAAWAALKPTTERLQASAQDLVRRMCAMKP